MNTLQRVVSALCSTALAAAPVAAPAFAVPVPASANEPWTVVPEDTLRDMRGGIDLGALVANFAIMRVVEVDGVVVARMQIVISNLDRLGNGGMPTISLSGPSAELVQIMNAAGNPGGVTGGALNTPASGAAANTGTSAAAANIAPAASPASSPPPESASVAAARSGSGTTASTPQVTSTTGNAGTVSATNTQSGSMAQFGSALASAVTAANGGALQPSGSAAPSTSSSAAAPTPAASSLPVSVAQNTVPQSSTASLGSTAPQGSTSPQNSTSPQSSTASSAAASAAGTTQIVPLGSTGQVAVLSNLPNATALTTAIQNNVRAATIQVQTTISATLNSLALLNASSLASSIRQQVSKGP
jgi:hypothetical protein